MAKRNELARDRARTLRTNMTPPEAKLWAALRAGRMGVKFKRQYPVGPYIADFAAPAEKLVIELDGDSHSASEAYDAMRTAFIQEKGFRVIRFTNSEAVTNLDGVLQAILIAAGRDV